MVDVVYGVLSVSPWLAVVVVVMLTRRYRDEMRREREYFHREIGEAYDELDERLAQQPEDPDPDVTQRLPRPYPLTDDQRSHEEAGRHRLDH